MRTGLGGLAPRLLSALAALLLAQVSAGAAPYAASLDALLARFEAHYQPAAHLEEAAWQLALMERQAELDALPALSVAERLSWSGFDSLTLHLDLSATVPLHRGTWAPRAALHDQRLATHAQEGAFAAAEARVRFMRDLLLLVVLRELDRDTTAALARMADTAWRPPTDRQEALLATPDERELIGLLTRVEGLRAFATERLPLLEERVAAALGESGALPALPGFATLTAQARLRAPQPAACVAGSPLAELARSRRDEALLDQRVKGALDLRVELYGSAAYRHDGPSGGSARGALTGSGLVATVGLEARLPLPAGSPVAGQLQAGVSPHGVDQALRLSWPPPVDPFAGTDEAPHAAAARLEADLERVAAEARSLLQALRSAEAELEAAEMQLLWLARDVHGAAAADVETALERAYLPAPHPVAELQFVQLRSDLAFARLTRAEVLLELRLVCGEA